MFSDSDAKRLCLEFLGSIAADVRPGAAWAVAPVVYLRLRRGFEGGLSTDERGRALRRLDSLRGRRKTRHVVVDGALYWATSENQNRILSAIAGRPLDDQVTKVGLASPIADIALRRAQRKLQKRGWAPSEFADFFRLVAEADAMIGLMASVLERLDPRVLIVATQHSLEVRALLWAAAEARVPSVYFPHAPTAANAAYRDLPFDLVGLRGAAERDAYSAWGARIERLEVVGVPAFSRSRIPKPDPGPPILALSPYPLSVQQNLVDLVRLAIPGRLTVATHPRDPSSPDMLSLPKAWDVNPLGSTWDLMASRNAIVIQSSSGVAWEAAALGRPVVQIDLPQVDRNYPFIDPAHIPCVDSAEDLRTVIGSVAGWHDAQRSLEWARAWGHPIGQDAVVSARDLVERGARQGTGALVLDGWSHVRVG